MERTAVVVKKSPDGKRSIAIDSLNAEHIYNTLQQNNLVKKFDLICNTILNGIRNPDLYDKEDINDRCKKVTAMKFKGKPNARIYCKEIKADDKTLIVICAEMLENKKNQKNQHREINLIEKVAGYEYSI
jgi:hypothetical protein